MLIVRNLGEIDGCWLMKVPTIDVDIFAMRQQCGKR